MTTPASIRARLLAMARELKSCADRDDVPEVTWGELNDVAALMREAAALVPDPAGETPADAEHQIVECGMLMCPYEAKLKTAERQIAELTRERGEPSNDRYGRICEALRVEWRLKTEQGIHHDHLSDLAWLIAELDHTRARLALLEAREGEIRKLEAKWRDAAIWEHDDPFNQCADELAALFAPSPATAQNGDLLCTACNTLVLFDQWAGACPNCGNGTMRELPVSSSPAGETPQEQP